MKPRKGFEKTKLEMQERRLGNSRQEALGKPSENAPHVLTEKHHMKDGKASKNETHRGQNIEKTTLPSSRVSNVRWGPTQNPLQGDEKLYREGCARRGNEQTGRRKTTCRQLVPHMNIHIYICIYVYVYIYMYLFI